MAWTSNVGELAEIAGKYLPPEPCGRYEIRYHVTLPFNQDVVRIDVVAWPVQHLGDDAIYLTALVTAEALYSAYSVKQAFGMIFEVARSARNQLRREYLEPLNQL